jgi:magnesium-transporting ATPase (P-type)
VLVLGISSEGVVLNHRRARLVLLLLTPAQETELHLMLLQRLASLLPAIRRDLLAQKTPLGVLRTVAAGEGRAGTATYINLTQEQVALELHTSLERERSVEEAARRLALHGPNVLEKARRAPRSIRLLRHLFSFFAVLLWVTALLCFRPGVDMPQLGAAILVVILVNGLFAFLQEARSDRAVETLEAMLSRTSRVVRSGALRDVDAALGQALARGVTVFARVSPDHKLRIVALLREMGEIVAVTGDGVNDAPALKKADIGIAMGRRGNEVAREAADVILLDDDFGTIVAAIEEGRGIYDNIRMFAAYVFNSNPQEMYPYLLWMTVPGVPLAMTVMGVLAVDLGTDLVPAMGLGIEPPEPGVMERPPRRRNERLLSLRFILRSYFVQGSLLAASCYATYFYMGWMQGAWRPGLPARAMTASPEGLRLEDASREYLQTLTVYFFPTVTTQIANVLCKRSWRTSLLSRDFLPEARRREILAGLAAWRPAFLPARLADPLAARAGPVLKRIGGVLDRHPVLLNLVSNPLIDLGVIAALGLCVLFFYTPLVRIYYFAPVPWHVYVFAFHGTLLLLAFEEAKKYLRRRGLALEFLG